MIPKDWPTTKKERTVTVKTISSDEKWEKTVRLTKKQKTYIKGMNAVRDFVDEYLETAGDSEEKTRVIDKLVSEIEQEKLKALVTEIEEYIEGTRICFEDINTENEDE